MSDSEKEGSSGNGVQSERLDLPADAQQPETMAGPVKSLPATSAPAPAAAVDPATAKAVEGVLFSDVGTTALLNRLKQSIASAKDLATFLKKRSTMEDDHANQLRRLCRMTLEGARGEKRQGSYATQFEEIVRIHERVSENEISFGLNMHQMSADLESMARDMDGQRKHWKQTAMVAEQRYQEAIRLLEKSKQKYDSLAVDYDHVKTGDRTPGRHFALRPKSGAQLEEDLQRKVNAADQEYQTKVQAAQQLRQELMTASRPQSVQALTELIREIDSAITMQLQKFASFNERLLLGNGLIVSPLNDGENQRRSMRDIVSQINNENDFNSYVTTFSHQVSAPKEIKYEKHPSLLAPPKPPPVQQPPRANTPPPQVGSFSNYGGQPQRMSADGIKNLSEFSPERVDQQPQLVYGEGYRQIAVQQQNPTPYQPYNPQAAFRPMATAAPNVSSPLNPLSPPRPGSRGGYAAARPIFGVHLQELFAREQSPVPVVVFQCILAVDLFGLDNEGIYRLSGNAAKVAQLKAQFDREGHLVDFRNPESFFHDVNIPATLLKQFFRDLPDPLLTRAAYREFLDAAAVPDDIGRRDKLHAAINGLPDPNYATLRALVLHLNRILQQVDVNRMTPNNLAVIFAPTLMGPNMGPVQDAALQHKVVETILINALQIFDDD